MVKKISNTSEYIATDLRLLAIAKLKLDVTSVRAEIKLDKEQDRGREQETNKENLKR